MTPSLLARRAASPLRAAMLAVGLTAMLTLSLAFLGALSDTASAAVPNLQRASRSTLADSFAAKDRPVSCPAGTKLLSGGGSVSGGVGQVILDGIRLNAPLKNVTTRAFEDAKGTGLEWELKPHPMCAEPLPRPGEKQATNARH